jgi:uncharacterized protein YhdP
LGGVRAAATYRCLLHPAEGTLENERGDVRVNEHGGSVTGRVTNLAAVPTVDLKVTANDASVADVLSLVPNDILAQKQDLEATGRATVAAQLTGPTYPPGSMRVAGTVDLAESRVAYKGIPGAIDALAGHIRFTDERVDIDSLVARFEGEPLRVAGSILMAPTQSVDLGIAGTIPLGLFGKWPAFKAVDDLGGTVRIKAHAAGPLAAPQAMRLDGSVDLDKVTAKPRGWTAPVEGVSGRVLLAGDEAKIQGIQGRIGASDFRVDGTVRGPLGKSPATRLELTSRLLDLDALARAAGAPVPKETPAGAAVVGAPLLLPKLPDVSAKIRVDSLVAQKLPLTNVAAQVSVLPAEGVVQVSEARAKAFTGTIGGDVRVTLAGKEPRYTFKVQGNDLEMNDFLTHFTPLKNALYGRMKLNGNFEGAGLTAQEAMAKLVANGDVIASEGRFAANPLLGQIAGLLDLPQLSEVRFKTLQSAFQIRDGRVATKDLAVDSPDAKWRAAGSVGFDGTVDYKLGILLSKPLADRAIRKVGDVARYLVNEKGELPVDLLISGNATRPTVSVDLSTAMSRVKGGALQDAARQLGVDEKTLADPKGQLTSPDAIKGVLDRLGGKPKPATPPPTTPPATTPATPPTTPATPPATAPSTPPAPPPAKDTSAADTTRGS